MTDTVRTPEGGSGPRKRSTPQYAFGSLFTAGGVLGLCLIPLSLFGMGTMANAMADATQAPPSVTGEQHPGADGSTGSDDPDGGSSVGPDESTASPTPSPDRGSDQGDEGSSENQEQVRDDVIHTIVWGETLTSISGDYGISVDMLAEYNGIRDVDLIYADSAMLIPYSQLRIPTEG